MTRIAVFASGNGSNFEAIAKAVINGKINAKLSLLVCDKPGAKVLNRAARLGVPVFVSCPKDFDSRETYEAHILTALDNAGAKFIVLAGYMRIVGQTLLDAYESKIINIHPSLLPEFPGLNAIARAFEAGRAQTGVTVHYVDAGVDTGEIIAQETVDILPEDTLEALEARVHVVEHRLYVDVLGRLL